jgi:hypothetical protein
LTGASGPPAAIRIMSTSAVASARTVGPSVRPMATSTEPVARTIRRRAPCSSHSTETVARSGWSPVPGGAVGKAPAKVRASSARVALVVSTDRSTPFARTLATVTAVSRGGPLLPADPFSRPVLAPGLPVGDEGGEELRGAARIRAVELAMQLRGVARAALPDGN